MKKRSRYSLTALTFLLLLGCHAGAQGVFAWRAPIDSIVRDGFYQIRLTPEIVAKCKTDLADVRILGPGGRFVSYVMKDSRRSDSVEQEREAVPGAVMVQKDSSDKHSYVDLRFPEAYEIDWLLFTVRDPLFYKREARLFVEGLRTGEWTTAAFITLAPGSGLIPIPAVKSGHLRLVISNADNAPLVIREVAGFQASRRLIAYLKAGGGYEVLAGDVQAGAPEYDLKYFTDSLKTVPPTLVPGPARHTAFANSKAGEPPAGTAPAGKPGLLLWGILLAILILLVYFSVRMVKAITQREPHDRI